MIESSNSDNDFDIEDILNDEDDENIEIEASQYKMNSDYFDVENILKDKNDCVVDNNMNAELENIFDFNMNEIIGIQDNDKQSQISDEVSK